ncbi:TPA: hypothetical protein ACPSKE_002752 [Legionella feeleii]
MTVQALLKLQNVEEFSTTFLNYGLFANAALLIAIFILLQESLIGISIPVAPFIGIIGAVYVFKVVFIDKRKLKCACVGRDSNVPLGFLS